MWSPWPLLLFCVIFFCLAMPFCGRPFKTLLCAVADKNNIAAIVDLVATFAVPALAGGRSSLAQPTIQVGCVYLTSTERDTAGAHRAHTHSHTGRVLLLFFAEVCRVHVSRRLIIPNRWRENWEAAVLLVVILIVGGRYESERGGSAGGRHGHVVIIDVVIVGIAEGDPRQATARSHAAEQRLQQADPARQQHFRVTHRPHWTSSHQHHWRRKFTHRTTLRPFSTEQNPRKPVQECFRSKFYWS